MFHIEAKSIPFTYVLFYYRTSYLVSCFYILLHIYKMVEILLVWKIPSNFIWGTKTVIGLNCY